VGYSVGVFGLHLFFIGGEVAGEPLCFAVAFEYQQVRADAVEEEAVVADDRATLRGFIP
jgi:hypothetical protein